MVKVSLLLSLLIFHDRFLFFLCLSSPWLRGRRKEGNYNDGYISDVRCNSLCHQGSNILWNDKNDSISIIDFSDRFLGDPAHDFARFFEYGDDFVRQIYEVYAGPKDSNLIERGRLFYKRLSIELMVDSFLTDKISFKKAKAFFDKVKSTKIGKER